MTFLNNLAQGVGYYVMLMCLIGAVTPMKFTLRLTDPDVHLATLYTCESGDSVLTRKKYLCSREEMEAQKEKVK
jgi:hypothetical protein